MSIVVSEESNLPIIDSVYLLNKIDNKVDNDPFLVSNKAVNELHGTTSNVKRRVTNQIQKFNRSADKQLSSKQVSDQETIITGYDAFGVVTPPHSLEGLAELYQISAPHYSAVNAKVANIVGLGFKFVETLATKREVESITEKKKLTRVRRRMDIHREQLYTLVDSWNEEETFVEILVKVWRDYEAMGNGYLEIGRNLDGTVGYVGHVPAQSVRIRRELDGFVQIIGKEVQFFANFGAGAPDKNGKISRLQNPIGSDHPNELLHIKKYFPGSSYYGIPDIVAAQQAIAGNEFSARFNLDYFENMAIPRNLITLKGAKLGDRALTDLLSFFETGLKGKHHRTLFLPLPADTANHKVEFSIEPVEAKTQDSSFNNYRKANLNEILMVHRVPITKISVADGVSLAVARDADKTFKEQTCAPEQRVLEKKLNRIIREQSEVFELRLNEMTLTDEDTTSKINERYRKSGVITANEVRAALGLPRIEGGDELFDLNKQSQTATETTVRERDSQRSANATDSSGEARNPKGDGRTDGTE